MRFDKHENCGEDCSEIVDDRGTYSSDVFARESINVIQNHDVAADHPLFLYLSYAAVHTPIQVPSKYKNMYRKKKGWSDSKKTYSGMVTAADQSLGQVIRAMKDKGIWKDTLVIFTSDNGALQKYGSNFPHRGFKGDVWEGGIAVDGIISGPARKKLGINGGMFKKLFHAVDWLPTLAEIVGASPNGKQLDGVSQFQSLKGGPAAREYLFLGYGDIKFARVKGVGYPPKDQLPRYVAIRTRNWKLVHDSQGKTRKLYNVLVDPEESTDIAQKNKNTKKIVEDLWEKLKVETERSKLPLQKDMTCPSNLAYTTTEWGERAWTTFCST